jgi:hypothetical protein
VVDDRIVDDEDRRSVAATVGIGFDVAGPDVGTETPGARW